MKKWEYKVEFIYSDIKLEDYLNEYGSDGWELISLRYTELEIESYHSLVFKREKQE